MRHGSGDVPARATVRWMAWRTVPLPTAQPAVAGSSDSRIDRGINDGQYWHGSGGIGPAGAACLWAVNHRGSEAAEDAAAIDRIRGSCTLRKALIANFVDVTRIEAAEQRLLPVRFYGQTRSAGALAFH